MTCHEVVNWFPLVQDKPAFKTTKLSSLLEVHGTKYIYMFISMCIYIYIHIYFSWRVAGTTLSKGLIRGD